MRAGDGEALGVAAGDDRLGGAVGLDDVADQDAGQERHSDLALRERESERHGLRHAVHEQADGDRLPAGGLRVALRHRHPPARRRRMARAAHGHRLLVAAQPPVGADVDERAGEQPERC